MNSNEFDIEKFIEKMGVGETCLSHFDECDINPNHTYKLNDNPFQSFTGQYVLEHRLWDIVWRDNDDPQHGGYHYEKTEDGKWNKIKN